MMSSEDTSEVQELEVMGNIMERLRRMVIECRRQGLLGAEPLVCDASLEAAFWLSVCATGSGYATGAARVGYTACVVASHEVIIVPRRDAARMTVSALSGDGLTALMWCKEPNWDFDLQQARGQ